MFKLLKYTALYTTAFAALSSIAFGIEKLPIEAVSTDAITTDTQATPPNSGDDHLALAWWIPVEFWEAVFARDETTSEADKKALIDSMKGISLIAVVQADISKFGAFRFYSKKEIESKFDLTFTNEKGKRKKLKKITEIDPDLEIVLGAIKPILGAAMGNLGNNFHFYVIDDQNADSSRTLDPYAKGTIEVQLARRDKTEMTAQIELPLNCLFVPRKCPNGKDAHVSWSFCPWTGKPLNE